MILLNGMLAYFIAEIFKQSGIISLLTCGIVMAHYTWFSLSPQGQTVSSVTFSIFGSAAESFVFAYLGLCCFTYSADVLSVPADPNSEPEYPWGIVLIIIMFVIVFCSRCFAVLSAHYLFRLCNRKGKADVNFNELCFIIYGGMIRGAIAFGLVLEIPEDFKERGAIITTTLALVIITTVVFGSFMPIV